MSSTKVYTNELDVIGTTNSQIWSLGTTGNYNTTNFDLTAQQKISNGLTGPVYSLVKNPIAKYVGNTISIDQVNGNDTIASTNKYSFPYKTIMSGLSGATGGDLVFINPGTYNESNLTIPQGVAVRGASTQVVNIQNLNAVTNTKIFTMENNCRLEDVTLNLGSGTNNLKLVGVQFNNGASIISKLRTAVVNVGSTGDSCIVYGVESGGTGPLGSNSSNAIRACTVNVNVGGTGSTGCAMIVDNANRFTVRDTNFYCNNISGNTGTYIGAMINCPSGQTGTLDIKTSTISGDTYDVARVGGNLFIGATDLIHSTTDGNSFSNILQPNTITYGLYGNYPPTSATYYLVPGNISIDGAVGGATGTALPFIQASILTSTIIKVVPALASTETITVNFYKNTESSPAFISQTINAASPTQYIISNKSISFTSNDTLIVKVATDNFAGSSVNQLIILINQY